MQTASFEAQETRLHLSEVLAKREISEGDSRSAMDVLGSAALADCFDAKAYVAQGIEHIFIAVS
jgi:DNA polymerase III delta prime subunit